MLKRTLTTVTALSLIAAAMYSSLYIDSPYPLVCLIALILALSFLETTSFIPGNVMSRVALLLACISTVYGMAFISDIPSVPVAERFAVLPAESVLFALSGISLLFLSFVFAMRKADFRASGAKVGWIAIQYLYYGIFAAIVFRILTSPAYILLDPDRAFGATIYLQDAAIYMFVAVVLTAKVSDIGAYLGGSVMGNLILNGRKMAPRISPKKTYTGLVFGLLTSTVVGFLALWYNPFCTFHVAIACCFGLLVGLAAVAGDLFESLAKRSFNIKDSGKTLPGIGGWFDLSDSVFWAGPVSYGLFVLNFVLLQ